MENKIAFNAKPNFLRAKTKRTEATRRLKSRLRRLHLHTVCEQAHCPNLGECFSKGTASFMILGKICTRHCGFCGVAKGIPAPPDPQEPIRLAEMAKALGLRHIVITSVTRDDLADGGAEQFYQAVVAVKRLVPGSTVEVLTPDFQGRIESVARVISAGPEVYNHNLETVPRLYPLVRPGADYQRSLSLLEWLSKNAHRIQTKTGIMVGMGETKEEIKSLMEDLLKAGCRLLTIGQYLAPSRHHFPVARYYGVEEFKELEELGEKMGFLRVFAGPLVRSSYNAGEIFHNECRQEYLQPLEGK